MSKKSKLLISETDFRKYLLNNYVDEEGNKISDRVLWSTKEFFDTTGMFTINKYTQDRQIVSMGTVSYWKKKLNLSEKDIYEFHKIITGRIKDISFEDWSRKYNKGYDKSISTYNRESIKRKLIKYLQLPNKYDDMSLEGVSDLAINLWKSLGLDAEEEMRNFYKRVI